jgi:predicted alpha/beta-hydrolase family hydrolase
MSAPRELTFDVPGAGQAVTAALHLPTAARARPPVIVLGHGITNDRHHPLIALTLDRLAARGVAGLRFNFPFKDRGDEAPDDSEVLLETFGTAITCARVELGEIGPLILGGKSLGARLAAAHQAANQAADGLLYLGFPLHRPDTPDQPRGDDLLAAGVPQLCIQGDQDPFCDLQRFATFHERITTPWQLELIPGGDHGLGLADAPPDEAGHALLDRIAQLTADWLASTVAAGK